MKTAAALCALVVATQAAATEVYFRFSADGADLYGRDNLEGTTVTGVLHGLLDNSWSLPTGVTVLSADSQMSTALGTWTFSQYVGSGILLAGGEVTDADMLGNFTGASADGYQFRFDFYYPDYSGGMNSLFWNGGDHASVGTFNYNGFAGVEYSLVPFEAAVPEPSTWAMLLLGFGAVGYGMRRRRRIAITLPQIA